MKKILTIGSATQDIFIEYPSCDAARTTTQDGSAYIMLREGAKISVDTVHYSIGGGAVNSAIAFARYGCTCGAACMVGDDEAGEHIVQTLTENNIDTNFVSTSDTHHTSTSFILSSPSGNRTLLVNRDASTHLDIASIPTDQFGSYNTLYITSLTGDAAPILPAITAAAQKNTCKVACNPGMEQLCAGSDAVLEALKNIDIFILNNCEARELIKRVHQHMQPSEKATGEEPELLGSWIEHETGCFNARDYFRYILGLGVETAVITNGSEGVYVAQGDTIYYCAAPNIDVVSTVGAGDAFGSAFVASLCDNLSIEQAIYNGMVNSASVIGHEDAQEGLCSRDELNTLTSAAHLNIQKFPLN